MAQPSAKAGVRHQAFLRDALHLLEILDNQLHELYTGGIVDLVANLLEDCSEQRQCDILEVFDLLVLGLAERLFKLLHEVHQHLKH